MPWHVQLLIHTHGVGLVILLRNGDARVKNRSDALIFSKSQSGHANLMRSELGVVSTSEALLLLEYIYSARSLKNMPIFAPLPLARYRCAKLGSGAGRPSRARPRCFGESPSFQPYHPAPNVLPTILHTIMKTERGVKDSSTRAHDHAQLASSSFRPSYTHRSTPFSPRALSLTISNHD